MNNVQLYKSVDVSKYASLDSLVRNPNISRRDFLKNTGRLGALAGSAYFSQACGGGDKPSGGPFAPGPVIPPNNPPTEPGNSITVKIVDFYNKSKAFPINSVTIGGVAYTLTTNEGSSAAIDGLASTFTTNDDGSTAVQNVPAGDHVVSYNGPNNHARTVKMTVNSGNNYYDAIDALPANFDLTLFDGAYRSWGGIFPDERLNVQDGQVKWGVKPTVWLDPNLRTIFSHPDDERRLFERINRNWNEQVPAYDSFFTGVRVREGRMTRGTPGTIVYTAEPIERGFALNQKWIRKNGTMYAAWVGLDSSDDPTLTETTLIQEAGNVTGVNDFGTGGDSVFRDTLTVVIKDFTGKDKRMGQFRSATPRQTRSPYDTSHIASELILPRETLPIVIDSQLELPDNASVQELEQIVSSIEFEGNDESDVDRQLRREQEDLPRGPIY